LEFFIRERRSLRIDGRLVQIGRGEVQIESASTNRNGIVANRRSEGANRVGISANRKGESANRKSVCK